MSYVYVGQLTRTPTRYSIGFQPLFYHVDVDLNGCHPCAVAGDERTLREGGGTKVWPGGCVDHYGLDVWVVGPRVGGLPVVSIEAGLRPRAVTVDPFGVLQAAPAAKAKHALPLTPKQWHTISGTVIGTYAVKVRAKGGAVYVGTHLNPKRPDGTWAPPGELDPTAGSCWRIEKGQSEWIPGNPVLLAWTDTEGATLEFWKFERGRSFGDAP